MIYFYVHKGKQDYLLASINHLKKRVKDANIVLLGDESNSEIPGTTGIIINDNYDKYAQEFSKIYKHLSPNNFDYELFCILRWFYIYEYMKRNGINQAIYIDSDVLFNNVVDEMNIPKKNFYYCFNSGHTSAFSISTIESLCNYIMANYQNDEKIQWLQSIYERRVKQGLPGGVSDMTLILSYAYLNSATSYDLSTVRNCTVFDHNVQESDGFELYKGNKAIYYQNGNYYFRDNLTGMLIKAASIHFQGDAKLYMLSVSKIDRGTPLHKYDYDKKTWINYTYFDRKTTKSKNMKIKEFIYKVLKKIKMLQAFR